MKLLLDTHVWLWSLLAPDRLTRKTARALENPDNELWISPISLWELLVLVEKGRVRLDADPGQWVQEVFAKIPFREAPLNMEVALRTRHLDLPHQDPADRLIAATALVYSLTLVTADSRLLASKTLKLFPCK